MQAKKRYALLLCSGVAVLLLLRLFARPTPAARASAARRTSVVPPKPPSPPVPPCSMDGCFNASRCRGRAALRVHIYPELSRQAGPGEQAPRVTELYLRLLRAVRESALYTADASEACLFLLAFDTTDRDAKSLAFVKNLPSHLRALDPELWDGGRNHVLVNLYPGTFPDYNLMELQLDPGLAMLAKASSTRQDLRPKFDLAFPLLNTETPLRSFEEPPPIPAVDGHLLGFKGKRYVYGLGSETRDGLHHLHDGRDLLLLTTCRHGNDWQSLQDARCAADNAAFDAWEYADVMDKATFCLVPRGRRPDSFRFLEALRAPCVPVVLSDGWVLPFSERIPWEDAVVRVPEHHLFTLPELLRSIPKERVQAMRRRGQQIYQHYFSSVDRVVGTMFEILRERLGFWGRRPVSAWSNDVASALFHLPSPPLAPPFNGRASDAAVSLALLVRSAGRSQLLRWLQGLRAQPRITEVVIFWEKKELLLRVPPSLLDVPVRVIEWGRDTGSKLLRPELLAGSGVLFLDDEHLLGGEELSALLSAWSASPWRLVGLEPRAHVWDARLRQWAYSSKRLRSYSLLLDSALLVHRYFLHLLSARLSASAARILDQAPVCGDLALNLLVAEATDKAPLALPSTRRPSPDPGRFSTRGQCLSALAGGLGGQLPLRSAQLDRRRGPEEGEEYADFADES